MLESIFEEVLDEYYHQYNAGDMDQDALESIAQQRFEDQCQWRVYLNHKFVWIVVCPAILVRAGSSTATVYTLTM